MMIVFIQHIPEPTSYMDSYIECTYGFKPSKELNCYSTVFYLHTNVSTCVQGSPHFGQVSVFFFPLPVPSLDAPLEGTVSLEGGVGSVGAFAKLAPIVKVLLATILTILCTVQP